MVTNLKIIYFIIFFNFYFEIFFFLKNFRFINFMYHFLAIHNPKENFKNLGLSTKLFIIIYLLFIVRYKRNWRGSYEKYVTSPPILFLKIFKIPILGSMQYFLNIIFDY